MALGEGTPPQTEIWTPAEELCL
uniref:Uncharacterized protein n=1 Tax=Anguilla anguilla TaxID=7936 RepID=A0A0E9V064_ANGAN